MTAVPPSTPDPSVRVPNPAILRSRWALLSRARPLPDDHPDLSREHLEAPHGRCPGCVTVPVSGREHLTPTRCPTGRRRSAPPLGTPSSPEPATPARVRRGFRNIRPTIPLPAPRTETRPTRPTRPRPPTGLPQPTLSHQLRHRQDHQTQQNGHRATAAHRLKIRFRGWRRYPGCRRTAPRSQRRSTR